MNPIILYVEFIQKKCMILYPISHSYFLIDNYCLIILVEWICWLNGQRKKAPTPEVNCNTSMYILLLLP